MDLRNKTGGNPSTSPSKTPIDCGTYHVKEVQGKKGHTETHVNQNSKGERKTDEKQGTEGSHAAPFMTTANWLLNRIHTKGSIAMPDFAADFDYYSEQDAHTAFTSLLSSTIVPERLRKPLRDKYEVWRRNNGEEYWASRQAVSQARISTKRTATELIASSEHVAKKLIHEQRTTESGSSLSPSTSSSSLPASVSPSHALYSPREATQGGQTPPHDFGEIPPAYLPPQESGDEEHHSSQSLFEPFTSSATPPEEYFVERGRYVLDMAELPGDSLSNGYRPVFILDNYASLEERLDKRLNDGGLARPDMVISLNGVAVGCGEIKPYLASRRSMDEDRARVAEFMKRTLHTRIVQARTESEFVVVGFCIFGDEVEISLMRWTDQREYVYRIYSGITLSSTIGNEDSIGQLLARLYFVRQWIKETTTVTSQQEETGATRLHYDRSLLKPTLRLL
ncbi:hypothetical protein BGX23_011671 [Mortierella sp. AD031]|nr:hypothetical protein BGX23_011671 [Mortierella sp. AD031]